MPRPLKLFTHRCRYRDTEIEEAEPPEGWKPILR
jgi:hypothetical protein